MLLGDLEEKARLAFRGQPPLRDVIHFLKSNPLRIPNTLHAKSHLSPDCDRLLPIETSFQDVSTPDVEASEIHHRVEIRERSKPHLLQDGLGRIIGQGLFVNDIVGPCARLDQVLELMSMQVRECLPG